MIPTVDCGRFLTLARADRELNYKLRGLSAKVRIGLGERPLDVSVVSGEITAVQAATGQAEISIHAPDRFWTAGLSGSIPQPGYESLTMGMSAGVEIKGDFTLVASYQSAWQRLYLVLREAVCGVAPRRPAQEPFRDTDTAVGRYKYVTANGTEARIYYEEAGTGAVPLMLQATAGADGRQYRHLLANPDMQKRFRMIAYDLPYHGKSLPPLGERWWERAYKPTRDSLMNWIVAIADALELEQPYFMGCSVGGQLALDLAAFHGERFGAFISLNGWYDKTPAFEGMDNDIFRSPAVAEDFPMALILGGTAPLAPETHAQEVYWVYRSNFPGIYAGDNDYFLHEHDLNLYGHRIDAHRKPVYAIAGEYDPTARDAIHGAPAVAAKVPGVVFVEAKGLGHFAPSDDPLAFGALILPILDEVLSVTKRH